MSSLVPYVVFSGTCREALEFYADALGGEIVSIETFGDSPIDVPADYGDRIYNAEFRAGGIVFKSSDDLPGFETSQGSNISLFIDYGSADEQRRVFDRLADGGKVLFPIDGHFGMLRDRYGVQWMVVHEPEGA